MSTLDLVILVIVAVFALLGLKKGFIVSLATLAGLALGIYLAVHFSHYAAGFIEKQFHPSSFWLPSLAYGLTFLVVLIGVYLVGKMVEKFVELTGMGILNRIGGALLGFVKGVLILSAAFYLIALADPKGMILSKETRGKSIFYEPVERVVPMILKLVGTKVKLPYST